MKNKFFAIGIIVLLAAGNLFATIFNLEVEVRVDEILTENVQVAAVYFSTSTGQIDENVTQTGYTASGGTISFTLNNVKNNYFLMVSSHGCFPTVKNQFRGVESEAFDPVKGDTTGTIERKINLESGLENVTRIKAEIVLPAGSTPTFVIAGISHTEMKDEIAFGVVYAASTTSYIYIDNVPDNLGEGYMIRVFSPKLNLAVDKEFKLTEEPLVDFTGSEAMPPGYEEEPAGNLLFKGIVRDAGGDAIVDAGVEVWNNFENKFFTKTDKNGYYGIYIDYFVPPDTYTFLINAQGYEGRKEEYYIASATYTQIFSFSGIGEAYGEISGEVRMGGSLVPNSKINVWGDESFWDVDGDTNTPAVDNPGNSWGDYYSRDGKFEITGLAPGNYILDVFSDFYKEGVYTYNTGETGKSEPTPGETLPTGESDHDSQGDDLRVTVFFSSCTVFSSSGTVISTYVVVNIPYETPAQPAKITGIIKLISGTGIEPEWPITVIAHEYWEDFKRFPFTADFELTVMGGPDTYVTLDHKQVRTEDIFSVNGSTPGQLGGALETIGMWWTDWDNGRLWWQAGAMYQPSPGSTVTVEYCYKDDPVTDFKSINGSGTSFPFELYVEDNKKYRVEINGSKYGVIWEKGLKDIRADLTIPATYYVLPEILVTSAGAIKGIVKKPNGEIFKPVYEQDKYLIMGILAKGKSVNSLSVGKVYKDGTFSIKGLLPGTYCLITKSTSTNILVEWADGILDNVAVKASTKPVKVVIHLRDIINVLPDANMSSVLTSGATTYFVNDKGSCIGIMGIPSGEKLNQDNLKKVLMDDPEIVFLWYPGYGWLSSKVPPGKYDLYTRAIREYSPEAGIGDPMGIFFSCKKGVPIDESLITGTTQFISLPEPVIGSADTVLTGTVAGSKIFTPENMLVIKNNFDEFFNVIPYIMLHNNDTGELAAISSLMPPATIDAEEAYIEAAQNEDLTALKNALINYPPSYKFRFLRPGNYTATAYSPNYPRYITQVYIEQGKTKTFNINFDESAGEGATITGSVSSGGNPVAGVSIIIKKKGIEKNITSNFSGNYKVKGLEKGYYQIEVSRAGYALKVVTVNMTQYKTYTKDISLTEGKETISGLVYSQYFPSPKVYEGARIVAYDIDSTDEVLGLYQAISDSNGYYEINGLISGHKYKVWVIAPGKRVYAVEHTACEEISGYNLVLSDILPDFNINYKVSGSSVTFNIESVKPLEYLPPDVKYSEGASFDASTAIDVSISTITAESIWKCSITPLIEDKVYTLSVGASAIDVGVGNKDYKPTEINFSLKKKTKVEIKLDEFFAKGGDIELDDTGEDSSYITIPVGAIREISAQGSAGIVSAFNAAGKKVADVEICAIGGFASLIFSKESIVGEIQDIISEIYEVKLENTDINENKNITLNLSYDRAKIGEVYSKVNIRRFNESLEKWEPVEGVTTIDPINGTVSIEVSNLNSADAGGSFSAQSITQSGKFAVFYGIPYEQTGPDSYSGDKFRIYNFPNPFNSSEKTVTLKNHGSLSASQTIEGTVLKYYVPAKYDSNADIEFYIYNIAGELVRTINEETRAGGYIYFAGWDGRNDGGEKCASGVYLLIPKVNGDTVMDEALKMAIIK